MTDIKVNDLIITSTRHTIFDEFFNLIDSHKGDNNSREDLLLKVLNISKDLYKCTLIKEQLDKWEIEKSNFIKEIERIDNEYKDKYRGVKYDNDGDDDWNEFINYPERMKNHKQKESKQNVNTRNQFLNSINNIDNINKEMTIHNIKIENMITQIDSNNTKLDKILSAIDDLKMIEKCNEIKKIEESLSVVLLQQVEEVIVSSISEKEEIVKEESNELCNNNDNQQ